jgi:hypothetical protein
VNPGPVACALFERLTPCQPLRTRDSAKLLRRLDSDERSELFQVAVIYASGPRVVDTGRPGPPHRRQLLEALIGRYRRAPALPARDHQILPLAPRSQRLAGLTPARALT